MLVAAGCSLAVQFHICSNISSFTLSDIRKFVSVFQKAAKEIEREGEKMLTKTNFFAFFTFNVIVVVLNCMVFVWGIVGRYSPCFSLNLSHELSTIDKKTISGNCHKTFSGIHLCVIQSDGCTSICCNETFLNVMQCEKDNLLKSFCQFFLQQVI